MGTSESYLYLLLGGFSVAVDANSRRSYSFVAGSAYTLREARQIKNYVLRASTVGTRVGIYKMGAEDSAMRSTPAAKLLFAELVY